MARFLMCWEFGGGLGHAGRFKSLARELLRRGHRVDLVLRDLVHTRALLHDLAAQGVRVLQAPMWFHQTVGVPNPTISLTEILMGNGYVQADTLAGLVSGWQGAMDLTQPDVVVADYAPTAAIAARTRGLRVATVGAAFYLPPDAAPLPPFRTWEPVAAGRVGHYDQLVLTAVNTVLRDNGAAPVTKLADVLRGDLPLLCTWAELDHYCDARVSSGMKPNYLGPSFLPSGGAPPEWPAGQGPCVFAYVRATHPDHVALLQALDQAGCRTLCYMPEVSAGKPAPVVSPGIAYSKGPVHLAQALPQARLAIFHAGEATLAQSILAGVPMLLLPTQAEQFLMAMRMEECGVAINAATRPRPTPFKSLIDQLLHQDSHRGAAQALARRHGGFSHEAQTQALADAFESLL